MANPSVTFTFTNGTAADATEVNTNFTDLINSLTDATKDLTIFAITGSGDARFTADTTLGSGSSDTVTINGRINADVVPTPTDAVDLGHAVLGWATLYLGDNGETVAITGAPAMSATYTLTLPVDAGVKGQVPHNDGSGTLSWQPGQSDTLNTTNNVTVLDDDGYRTILTDATSGTRTAVLPTAADNGGRIVTVKKVDSSSNQVGVGPEGAETIDGDNALRRLLAQYDALTVQCDGTEWHIIDRTYHERWQKKSTGAITTNAVAFMEFNGLTVGDTYQVQFVADVVFKNFDTGGSVQVYDGATNFTTLSGEHASASAGNIRDKLVFSESIVVSNTTLSFQGNSLSGSDTSLQSTRGVIRHDRTGAETTDFT